MNAGSRSADLGASGWTYGYKQGTSMATPIVTGVVSLMLSVNPGLDTSQVEAILKQTARPFAGGSPSCSSTVGDLYYCGAGMLDAGAAVALAAQTVTYASNRAPPTTSSPPTWPSNSPLIAPTSC
jgi:serine protease